MKTKKVFLSNLPLLLIGFLLLSGCSAKTDTVEKNVMPDRFAMPEVRPQQTVPTDGSLYSEQSMDLYKDSRASQVGDIILVEVVETSNGRKSARTETERESTIEAGITQFFGFEKWLAGKNANFTPSATSLEASSINDFEGTGETERNSTVTATLSARVIDVTMEGNLVIEGYREIRVNNETQFLIVSGIVRPSDISPDNSIRSIFIANARIEYTGSGVISEKQQPGWLARGLDILWPF